MEVKYDRCSIDVTPSTDLMRGPRPSTNSMGVSGTVARPVFHNATNRIPDSSVVPWTTSSSYVKKNTTFFVNMATSSGRSGNASGRVDVPPILPSKPSCNRTRPLARSIHATPSSVDVPTPTNPLRAQGCQTLPTQHPIPYQRLQTRLQQTDPRSSHVLHVPVWLLHPRSSKYTFVIRHVKLYCMTSLKKHVEPITAPLV